MWKWSDLKRLLKAKQEDYVLDSAIITWPVEKVYLNDTMDYLPDDAHITILYIPDIYNPDLGFTKEDVLDAIRDTDWDIMINPKVKGLEFFGPENDVAVLTLDHPYLQQYRDNVKMALAKRGIVVEETYPEYKPHVTIKSDADTDREFDNRIWAGPVELWWGDEYIKVK